MRRSNTESQDTNGAAAGRRRRSALATAVSFIGRLAGRGATRAVKRRIHLALLFVASTVAVASGQGAGPVSITFESIPGMTAIDNLNSAFVTTGARLGTQLQTSHGVSFKSAVDYVALVRLGSGHATSGVNGIGGVSASNVLRYGQPVVITFSVPGSPSDLAVTDFVSIRGDQAPAPGSAKMEAFDLSGALIGSVTAADVPGEYVVSLVVTDADGQSSDPDTVVVSSLNAAPVADAGVAQGAFVGRLVTLDGSASYDPDSDPLYFSWTLDTPDGSSAALSAETTAHPTFTPDIPGTYTSTLTVSDPFGGTSADGVVVMAITVEQFAAEQVVHALNTVGTLTPQQLAARGHRHAMQNLLTQAIAALQAGDIDEARSKLRQVIERTDGCALRGSPDGNGPSRDWVTDCAAQATLQERLTAALATLTQ